MTDDEMQLALIERDLDGLRQRLILHQRLLIEQLAPHGFAPDLIDRLLTDIDEWGAAQVHRALVDRPEHYNLTALPPARQAIVGPLLDQVGDAAYDFDNLVVAREAILAAADPQHRRVHPWFGREFSIDDHGTTLRFLGSPAELEPAVMTAVPNRTAPQHGPDAAPSPHPRRRRDRDR